MANCSTCGYPPRVHEGPHGYVTCSCDKKGDVVIETLSNLLNGEGFGFTTRNVEKVINEYAHKNNVTFIQVMYNNNSSPWIIFRRK